MNDHATTCDVFIAHSPGDVKLAMELATVCRSNGLIVVTDADLLPAENASVVLWEALAESSALLVILSKAGLSPINGIEIGAAQAWNKPVFGVVSDPSLTHMPAQFSESNLYTPGRIGEIIRAIKLSRTELSEQDWSVLADLYSATEVSVDQLALDPILLGKLVKRFNAATGKAMSGERLLSELLRMRKQGKLKRSRATLRPHSRKGTA